ncbi:hypothetical protein AAG906_019960 [Vitis piasezkii]
MAPRRDKKQEKKITSPKRLRGPTLKPEIAKKRSEGLKINIQYNDDGEGVGEGYVQLVSYMGVVVPVELKEKLWDCVKDKPEYLLQPPTKYNYILIEDWRKLVANRLSKEFQVKSKKGKERRAKYVYIHRVSRKGYAGLQEELMGLVEAARLKKGEYDEVTRPVVEKISKSLPSVGNSRKSYLQVTSQRLARDKLVHLGEQRSLALSSVAPENGVSISRHSRRAAKSLRIKGYSRRAAVGFHLEVPSFHLVAYIGQLQEEIHHTHWIVDFLSFEMVYSMHQLDFRKCSKSGCYDCHQEYASWQILFTFSPCIPDLLLANDFQALPKIPHNSPQS